MSKVEDLLGLEVGSRFVLYPADAVYTVSKIIEKTKEDVSVMVVSDLDPSSRINWRFGLWNVTGCFDFNMDEVYLYDLNDLGVSKKKILEMERSLPKSRESASFKFHGQTFYLQDVSNAEGREKELIFFGSRRGAARELDIRFPPGQEPCVECFVRLPTDYEENEYFENDLEFFQKNFRVLA